MHIWTIGRDGITKDYGLAYSYEIDIDILSSGKSRFEMSVDNERGDCTLGLGYSEGDFALAKDDFNTYFGVIDSTENNVLVITDILSLLNFEFPATRMSGDSFELHCKKLIEYYLIKDSNKLMSNIVIEVGSNTKHIYQPSDPPTPTNLMKYLINGFKKYNVVWEFVRIENGKIYTRISAKKDSIQFKTDIHGIRNLDISTTEVGKGVENHIMIVDATTSNSEQPKVLSNWWATNENKVTSDRNDPKIVKPTKTIVWIYDTTAEDKPNYIDVATSELQSSFYAHEITFEIHKNSKLLEVSKLEIGTLAKIYRKNQDGTSTKLDSVLTAYRYSDDSDYIELSFGHVRSRFSELLE